MTREDVYKLIDGEREYQESVWPANETTQHSEHALTLIRIYLRKAEDVWNATKDEQPTMDVIRKIAGIAVRSMEQNGAPKRFF